MILLEDDFLFNQMTTLYVTKFGGLSVHYYYLERPHWESVSAYIMQLNRMEIVCTWIVKIKRPIR